MIVSLCDDGGSDKAAEAALVWTKACGMGITLGIAVPSHMSEVPLFGRGRTPCAGVPATMTKRLPETVKRDPREIDIAPAPF